MGPVTGVAAGTGGIAVVDGSQMYRRSSQDSKKYHSDGEEEE